MEYTKVQLTWTRSDTFRSAEPAAKGTWISLVSHCADQENGGRIIDCQEWTERRWMATCGVTRGEVDACVAAELAQWDGRTLLVRGYDVTGERECLRQREKARNYRQRDHDNTGGRTGTREGTGTGGRGGTRDGAQARPAQARPAQASPAQATASPPPVVPGADTALPTQSAAACPQEPQEAHRVEKRHLEQRTKGVNAERVRNGVIAGDLLAVLAAFGCETSGAYADEWARDCDGLQLGMVVVILAWRLWRKDPVRLPSGWRQALTAWRTLGKPTKDSLVSELLAGFGIELPKRDDSTSTASSGGTP